MAWLVFIFKERGMSSLLLRKLPQLLRKDQPVKEHGDVDYSIYRMSGKETLFSLVIAGVMYFFIGYLFYHSLAAAIILSLFAGFHPRITANKKAKRRLDELQSQFKEVLLTLSSSLSAGRSVENAFREAVRDLILLYPNPNTVILMELRRIVHKLDLGHTVEQAMADFSRRSGLEDIRNFCDVFEISKRSGGNLNDIIRRTSQIIHEKTEIYQEITVMVAQKRFESRILSAAPFTVVAFIGQSSPDYMAPLYHSAGGSALMTVCLFLLAGCYFVSGKLMNFQV